MKRSRSIAASALMILAAAFPSARAQTYSVLYNFGSTPGDPLAPGSPGILAQGRDGNIYGTTSSGGAYDDGAVFKITPNGVLTVLHSFDCIDEGENGCFPLSGLTLGRDGNFYGTTVAGGAGGNNYGTIFKITPGGVLTVLYSFTDDVDGSSPLAPPIQGVDGNFYGVTGQGIYGCGGVYKITPSGTFTSLYVFDYLHGCFAYEPLVEAIDGNFYGTTAGGGESGQGTVFKITPRGILSVVYSFDGTHGTDPAAPLIQASDGNFYGTTATGGNNDNGVLFEMTPAGKLTFAHDFNVADGETPVAAVVQATDGSLYGTSSAGGILGDGVIYRASTPGRFPVLYDFDSATGAQPQSALLQHTNGILYGDAENGGTHFDGTFYSLNIGASPFVSLVTGGGKVGSSIGILGQDLEGTTAVFFNGTPATFNVIEDTFLGAVIPQGAKTGFITVTTANGTLMTNRRFVVIR